MKITEILEHYKTDKKKLIETLCQDPIKREIETWQNEYDGEHAILKKPDKIYYDSDGMAQSVKIVKVPVPYQEEIVEVGVAFLFGAPVEIVLNNNDDKYKKAFDMFNKVRKDNKLDYFYIELATRLFIETKVAELWYTYKDADGKTKYRVMLLSKKNGNDIYVHFDDHNDMDAFIRKYKTTDLEKKSFEHIDVYMVDKIFKYKRAGDSDWEEPTKVANDFGKIPAIYYEIEKPIWYKVQRAIDRYEELISRHGDTNDYYGDPILKLKGELKKEDTSGGKKRKDLQVKGKSGKTLHFREKLGSDGKVVYGDAEFLTWDSAPESIKMEIENLNKIILSKTKTPDLNFDNVKGLGSLPGITVKLMFLGSILKAMNRHKIFGAGLTRENNLIKAMLGKTLKKESEGYGENTFKELDISINFGNVLPDSIVEMIENLSKAVAGEPIMTRDAAVRRNPLVDDPEGEIEKMDEDEKKVSDLAKSYEA